MCFKFSSEVFFLLFRALIYFREVAERSKAHAWKACIRANVSRVRIPSSLLQGPISLTCGFFVLQPFSLSIFKVNYYINLSPLSS